MKAQPRPNYSIELEEAQSKSGKRLYFLAGSLCSPLFYFFMTRMAPNYIDYVPGRIFISVIGILFYIVSYSQKVAFRFYYSMLLTLGISYIGLYILLLQLNYWSLFHRWSYFTVAAIVCSAALRWRDYLILSAVAIGLPILASPWNPLTTLEIVHFHSANITAFVVIGFSVHSHFYYKKVSAELAASLIEKTKMSALGEMSGGVSHEVNNPLAVINGTTQILKRNLEQGKNDPEKMLAQVIRIEKMAVRISTIVNGLAQFSKSEMSEANSPCRIEDLLHSLKRINEDKFKLASVEFRLIGHDHLDDRIEIQKNQLIQALNNLIDNALDACKNSPHPLVELRVNKKNTFYQFDVYDNGPGVSDNLVNKIMQPFFTTKEVGAGTGLGLSIALGIAQRHGGDLEYIKSDKESFFRLSIFSKT